MFVAKNLSDLGKALEVWSKDATDRAIAARRLQDKQFARGEASAYKSLAELIRTGQLTIEPTKPEPEEEHPNKLVTGTHARLIDEWVTYIGEAEHQDGEEYWENFKNVDEVMGDFALVLHELYGTNSES
jgi:hypothetical protein